MSSTFAIGWPFIELQQVESTNNYATGMVHAGMAQHGTAVFAHHQTKGKGQRNKQWLGEADKNIALSIIWQPAGLVLSQSFHLSMATAVGVYQFFSKYAGGDTKIKWPNDIYWRDRKAAGILIENIVQGSEWKAAIVGVGININQTTFETLPTNPVSIKQITGKDYNPVTLAKELCQLLTESYAVLNRLPSQTIATYKNQLYGLNKLVRLKKGSRVFEAVIKDVTPLGELVVSHSIEERFSVGDVEWLI